MAAPARTACLFAALAALASASSAKPAPVVFEVNRGQADPRACYAGRAGALLFEIGGTGLALAPLDACPADEPVTLSFPGGNGAPPLVAGKVLPSTSSYFLGNDPAGWITGVPHVERVRMVDAYPGVDVVVHGENGALELDFEIAAGRDPSVIAMGISSAADVCPEPDGALTLGTPAGRLRLGPPVTWQGASRIGARYVIGEGSPLTIRVAVDDHDPGAPLVVDPTIVWSSYLGGEAADLAQGIAIDAQGNTYTSGQTLSVAFPLKNPYLGANPHPGSDVTYVTKIDAAGQLVYSTYLGGSVTERLGGIAADSLGNAYVTGLTSSPDFPTQNPIMAFQGGYDVYVTKLTPDGSALVYSTYLGGSDSDVATGIAVDGGEAYVTGQTSSNDFPIANAFQANYAGSGDGFVAKLDASGASLAYSTYVGGSAYDYPSRVTVDSQGQAAITGRTQSPDYPTFRAFQGSLPSPTMSTFVTKLSDTGRSLVFSTYLGGSVDDEGFDVASDANGRTWVAGSATSADFPVRNAYQPNLSGSKDGFVSCFDASGGLAYSTFFGGSQDDDARGISVFASGAVAFGGTTGSSDLPVMNPIQPALAGQNDAFVATLDGAGSLVTSSYLGGADNDGISDLDAGSADTIVATGSTLSTDFPSVTPFQATPGGFVDAFVTRIARCNAIALAPASLPSGTVGAPYSQTITGSGGSAPYTYAVTAGALPPGLSLSASGVIFGTPASTGSYGFTVTATDSQSCTGQSPYALSIGGGGFPDDLVAGQGLGMPNPNRVRVFVSDGTATSTDFLAYGASAWGVNVAPGNVQAATNDQILTGPGPGATLGPQARSFLRDGTPISKINFYAYGTLRFGLNVAGASVDADTFEEILTGAGPGAVFGPHVRGWNFDNVAISSIAKISYFAYGTLKYGVNVGSANLDADAFDEVLTGAGSGAVFSSNVRGWNYDATTVSAIAKINFNAFTYQGFGVNVAGGDVDADGFGEIACAPGPGVTHPARFLGFDYDGASLTAIPGFDVTIGTGYGGRVGLGDLSGDGSGDLVAGFGPDPAASSTVSPFLYTGSALVPLLAIDPFPGAFHGVSPAAGNLGF